VGAREVVRLVAELKMMKDKMKEMEKEGEMMAEKLRVLRKEKNDLAKVFINLKKKYEAVVHEMENNKELEITREELQKHKQANAKLLKQCSDALESEKNTSAKLGEAKEKIEELEKTVAKLRGVLVKANQRFQEDKQAIKDLRGELSTAKQTNEDLLVELEHVRSSSAGTDSLKSTIKELEEKVERLAGEIEAVGQEKETVSAEFEAYRVKAHAALQTNAEEIGKIESYVEKISKMEGEAKELKQKEISLNETILELKGSVAANAELQEQFRDLQDENAELLTQNEESKRNLQQFNSQWEQKYTQLEQTVKQKTNLVEQLEAKEAELLNQLEEEKKSSQSSTSLADFGGLTRSDGHLSSSGGAFREEGAQYLLHAQQKALREDELSQSRFKIEQLTELLRERDEEQRVLKSSEARIKEELEILKRASPQQNGSPDYLKTIVLKYMENPESQHKHLLPVLAKLLHFTQSETESVRFLPKSRSWW